MDKKGLAATFEVRKTLIKGRPPFISTQLLLTAPSRLPERKKLEPRGPTLILFDGTKAEIGPENPVPNVQRLIRLVQAANGVLVEGQSVAIDELDVDGQRR